METRANVGRGGGTKRRGPEGQGMCLIVFSVGRAGVKDLVGVGGVVLWAG